MDDIATSIQGGIDMYCIYDFYREELHEKTYSTEEKAKEAVKRIEEYRDKWKQSHDLMILKVVE